MEGVRAECVVGHMGHEATPVETRVLVDCEKANGDGISFRFSGCGVKVKTSTFQDIKNAGISAFGSAEMEGTKKEAWKSILHDVSQEVCGGTFLAIMGPSGSGKTTLLSLLTLSLTAGNATGIVTLNGHPFDTSLLRSHCSFMPQDDHLWPFLTCRETLSYAADFYLSNSANERKADVDRLLKDMGLEKCANTLCGNKFLKGLSGGQKRRLSLAIALIKKPSVLFLDEPTSGLDSASATWIVDFLRKLVMREKIAVVCTIHQPSTALYQQFDKTMLLSGGRVAFSGESTDAVNYFKEVTGTPIPKDYSAAEFVLEIINSDFGDHRKKDEVNNILDQWKNRRNSMVKPVVLPTKLPERSIKPASFLVQVMIHFRRQLLLSWRDPILYVSRMAIFLICCIFFAWVYADARFRHQDQIVNRVFLCMWVTAVPTCMAVIAVYAYNQELMELRREIKDGMYSPIAYVLGNTILQIPFMVILALSALGVGPYGISNFHAPQFGVLLLIYSLALWTFENMAQFLSIVFVNPLLGMLVFICCWFASFLFSGFFITESSLQWPLRIFMYIMPHRWTLGSLIKEDFRHAEYDGAVDDATSNGPGFKCPGGDPMQCFGRTGQQVLTSLSSTFTLVEPSDTLGRDLLIVFGIGAAYKVLFLMLFLARTRGGKLPSPPPPAGMGGMRAPLSAASPSVGSG